jgi:predicted nucleotidyltransferase
MTERLNPELRQEILRIARARGASNVCIFGSLSRGQGRADSDLDLLVDLDEGRSLLDLIAFEHGVEDLLDRRIGDRILISSSAFV